MLPRILAVAVLFFSILYLPFSASVILALLGMIYFPYFAEAVILFLVSDSIYGVPGAGFFDFVYIATVFSLVLLVIIELLKKKLRLNQN